MTTTPDDIPDVVATDESGGVVYVWHGHPDVTELAELASNTLARVAIETAHMIRRRDGLVLKLGDRAPEEEVPATPELHLERVDLIPPPEEIPEHTPLTDEQLSTVALYLLLRTADDDAFYFDDKDIIKALRPGSQISIERIKDDGGVVFRAHTGSLSVIDIGEAVNGE